MSTRQGKEKIWGYLIHLGYNMWWESDAPRMGDEYLNASNVLRFDKEVWDELLTHMVDAGINTVVIDLGEGVQYQSHPEISVKGAWSVESLRKELTKMRKMGLNPVPKLNFSTTHDEWLGEYSRCVSSQKYYQVCKDLINEVIDIFDTPDFFHIGMDEETYDHQKYYNYAVIRQGDYWWKDLYFYIDVIEKRGVRPWMWSDYIWRHEEEFIKKMPKSVLQSNWYYGSFDATAGYYVKERIDAYLKLAENKFDQVPTGSNCWWVCVANFPETVKFCKDNINSEKLVGFLQTVWQPTVKKRKYRHLDAIDFVKQGRALYYNTPIKK